VRAAASRCTSSVAPKATRVGVEARDELHQVLDRRVAAQADRAPAVELEERRDDLHAEVVGIPRDRGHDDRAAVRLDRGRVSQHAREDLAGDDGAEVLLGDSDRALVPQAAELPLRRDEHALERVAHREATRPHAVEHERHRLALVAGHERRDVVERELAVRVRAGQLAGLRCEGLRERVAGAVEVLGQGGPRRTGQGFLEDLAQSPRGGRQ
jgi:hypothetical protein